MTEKSDKVKFEMENEPKKGLCRKTAKKDKSCVHQWWLVEVNICKSIVLIWLLRFYAFEFPFNTEHSHLIFLLQHTWTTLYDSNQICFSFRHIHSYFSFYSSSHYLIYSPIGITHANNRAIKRTRTTVNKPTRNAREIKYVCHKLKIKLKITRLSLFNYLCILKPFNFHIEFHNKFHSFFSSRFSFFNFLWTCSAFTLRTTCQIFYICKLIPIYLFLSYCCARVPHMLGVTNGNSSMYHPFDFETKRSHKSHFNCFNRWFISMKFLLFLNAFLVQM